MIRVVMAKNNKGKRLERIITKQILKIVLVVIRSCKILMASQDNTTEVGCRFPIYIPKRVIEVNPGFRCLLEKLIHYLAPTGGLKKTENNLKKVQELVCLKQQDFFLYQVLYDNLNMLLRNYETMCSDLPSNSESLKFLQILRDSKMNAEIEVSLKSQEQVEGIIKEIVPEIPKNSLSIPSVVKEKLIFEMGEIINKQCKTLLKMHAISSIQECSLLPNALQLPNQLKEERKMLQQLQETLNELKNLRNIQLEQYEKVLIDTINTLQELILNYRLKGPPEQHCIISNHLELQSEALGLKLQILKTEILCETYTEDVVAALQRINSSLNEEIEDTDRQISYAQHALQSYEALGSSFNKLVSEYTSLKEKIDNKNWALENLEKKVTDS